ncbi:glycosyl hydrolase 36 superfamily [Mucilaginibacter gossypii]|uniref:Glycosyl hydrolase 36 superfamily n=3 Tax=Mucilaginibacter TaxID=423349 RepID=A0A1G8BX31_9SPHI|nr:glycosyl hydrolase 36 superfamily [Mucilaginibacter gossypii]
MFVHNITICLHFYLVRQQPNYIFTCMKKRLLISTALSCFVFCIAGAQQSSNKALARKILADIRLDTVQAKALKLLSGFSAGTSYSEVWIRDFNTFINGSLKVHPKEEVKTKLLMFFRIQGQGGDIVDGVVDSAKASVGYKYRYSSLLPGWAAHKNTVETDQESSLIQAVKKYIDFTGDQSILNECIGGKTILQRMEAALAYLHKDRWSEKYGLITGATTIDWGDVQSENGWGVAINDKTKWALDIYDNAMFVKAVQDFLAMAPRGYKAQTDWKAVASKVTANVRKYLWDAAAQKYIPHIYLDGSPFSSDFNEKEILYTGGSICAIIAGFNTPAEVLEINRQMLAAAAKEKHATIGITVYPPYPEKQYPNMKPYSYQNGGDWTWFGGRMIAPLIIYGRPQEAYAELSPMLDRMLANEGFFEWYDVQSGAPKGSGDFRGEAGVLYDAITALRQWAAKNR